VREERPLRGKAGGAIAVGRGTCGGQTHWAQTSCASRKSFSANVLNPEGGQYAVRNSRHVVTIG
jgi:multimeric flavodoxin WrbA